VTSDPMFARLYKGVVDGVVFIKTMERSHQKE
jgi:hypothetical protein